MKVGNIVVVNATAPRRFRNLKPGTLWKVVADGPGGFYVGDAAHPRIQTLKEYFERVGANEALAIQATGNTDIAVRINALKAFRPELKTPGKYVANGVAFNVSANTARALALKNPGKLLQRKFAGAR